MNRHRNFLRSVRPALLASVTGAALCSMTATGQAQSPYTGYPQGSAPVQNTEPRRLPQQQMARPVTNGSRPLSLTAGQQSPPSEVQQQLQLLYQQNGQPMPQMVSRQAVQTQPRNFARPPQYVNQASPAESQEEENGFIDRMARFFKFGDDKPRRRHGPPVDPGMDYPTASEAKAGSPPPAPGASGSSLTDIPAIPSVPPGAAASPQPNLFQAPSSANPIDNMIPPTPPTTVQTTPSPATPAATRTATSTSVPAAPPKYSPQQTASAAPGMQAAPQATETGTPVAEATASKSSLPVLDFNAPLPEQAPSIAPGEPGDTQAAAVPATPPAASQDPFDNLFPADGAATQPAEQQMANRQPDELDADEDAEEVAEEAEEAAAQAAKQSQSELQPYTGLTLDTPPLPPSGGTAEMPNLPTPPAPETQTASNTPKVELKLPEEDRETAKPTQAPAQKPQSKMERIAARKGQEGLKGFCPVALRDDRELLDASSAFTAIHNGREYQFSSQAALEKFLAAPDRYAPAANGCDVIHMALTGENLQGKLDYACWYKGRLYLFSTVETMETFVAAPSSHAVQL